MPTVLRPEQHELLLPDAASGLVFGTADTGYLTVTPPAIGGGDYRTGDVERLREDGVAFGEDFMGAVTYTFEMTALSPVGSATPRRSVDDLVARFRSQWRARAFRSSSSAYAVLRTNVGGRTSRCYGRPRDQAATPGNLTSRGATPLTAMFVLNDGLWYDDTLNTETRTLNASTLEGGFAAPFSTPLSTVASPDSIARAFTVGGTEPTWLYTVFTAGTGPLIAPRISVRQAGVQLFEVGLSGTVPAGTSVVVDPRPWSRVVRRTDGAAVGLTAATPPLQRLRVDPGNYGFTVRAGDLTGTGSVSLQWRNATATP